MMPVVPDLPTPYNIFWRELRFALIAAGATHVQLLSAVERLKVGVDKEGTPGHGRTGYLNSTTDGAEINPYQAVREYVAHVVNGAPAPEWLRNAEKP